MQPAAVGAAGPALVLPSAPGAVTAAVTNDSTGVMPGQQTALTSYLSNFSPGQLGIAGLANDLVLSLPVPEWQWHAWYVESTADEQIAGFAGDVTFYTVPTNRRAYLDGVNLVRSTGDNEIDRFYITPPAAYSEDRTGSIPIKLAAGATSLFWPDPGGVQTISEHYIPAGPLLMEPGTTLGFRNDGSGVAASRFNFYMYLRLTPLVRNSAPV